MRGIVALLCAQASAMWLIMCVLTLPDKNLSISRLEKLILGFFWVITFLSWVVLRKRDELIRFFSYLWPFLTTFWFWKWLYEQIARLGLSIGTTYKAYLVALNVIMAFFTLCIEIWRYSEKSLLHRVLLWFITMPGWFNKGKVFIPLAYSTIIWATVALSWFFGISADVGGLFYDIYIYLWHG